MSKRFTEKQGFKPQIIKLILQLRNQNIFHELTNFQKAKKNTFNAPPQMHIVT